ncbi:hypothetical protein PVAP13_1NG514100 [Panicum virgatum]|uniref:Uncharacterized protein n=1 Tax=Panicum virgatum TaxID=38727 RepID=A0A8T0WUL7_PANVG|nr:hypothetical protein PVAP13_1NG514100 [Panicum virgatum]
MVVLLSRRIKSLQAFSDGGDNGCGVIFGEGAVIFCLLCFISGRRVEPLGVAGEAGGLGASVFSVGGGKRRLFLPRVVGLHCKAVRWCFCCLCFGSGDRVKLLGGAFFCSGIFPSSGGGGMSYVWPLFCEKGGLFSIPVGSRGRAAGGAGSGGFVVPAVGFAVGMVGNCRSLFRIVDVLVDGRGLHLWGDALLPCELLLPGWRGWRL